MSEPPKTTASPAERHVAMSTNMEVMSCTLGFFFLCAILCAAFRLLYLKRLESQRRTAPNRPVHFNSHSNGPVDHPVWLINFVGLTRSEIDSIGTIRYKEGEGLIEATECSVCLGEFEENEDVRLLPKCGHAFHAPCIDTWLRSHKNCPLCRAPVVVGNVGEAVGNETVVEVSEVETETEVENRVGEGGSGDEIDVGFGDLMVIESGIVGISKNCDSRGLEIERELDRVGGGGSGDEIDMGFGDVTLVDVEIGGNSKNCDFREIRGLGIEKELDLHNPVRAGGSGVEIDMGFGDVTLVDVEIGENSKNCDFREIRGLDIERELDRHDRVGGGGSGAEIDMGFGDVTLVDVEIGGNSKNCNFREIRGLGIEKELDLHNPVRAGGSDVEIDMGFGDVTLVDVEIGRNLKICDYGEIRGLGIERNLDYHDRVGEGGSGAEIDMGLDDVTQIDDEIGRNWKICDHRAGKKMDRDHQNWVAEDGYSAEIDLICCSNAQIDDKIGKKSKISNSRAFGNLVGAEPMERSLSMGLNSSKLGKSKRHSFKCNGNENSGFYRLIRSASSGRLSNLSNLSIMKRCNSGSWGNFRSQDSILPM